jgi:hypothetical protein
MIKHVTTGVAEYFVKTKNVTLTKHVTTGVAEYFVKTKNVTLTKQVTTVIHFESNSTFTIYHSILDGLT